MTFIERPIYLLRIRFIETPLQRLCNHELLLDMSSLKEVTIGRSPDNVIVIPDPSVSRRHAVITWEGDSLVLKDLNSKNGTYMLENGVAYRIDKLVIYDKIRARLGLYTIIELEVIKR